MWVVVLCSLFFLSNAAVGNNVAGQACTGKILTLDPVCLGYSLTTCGTVGVYVNVTYQNALIFEEVLDDARDLERCQEEQTGSCKTCLKFASIVVKPTYAKFCPKLVVTCTVFGKPVSTTQNLDCIELGGDCNATNCIDCASKAGCGWCGEKKMCLSSLREEAYCDTCEKQWYPEDTCPRPLAVEQGMESGAVAAIIIIPLALIVCIVMTFFFYRKRQSLKHQPTGGPIELQADYEENYSPVVATPIPDSPVPPENIGSS